MRTYKEYYAMAKAHEDKWLSQQKTEWWKKKEFSDGIGLKGEYFETVNKFLVIDAKNDVSLFSNYTNVRNYEWSCLFGMLGQALVDWCVENVSCKNLWSFYFEINRVVDGKDDFYSCTYKVKKDNSKTKEIVKVSGQTLKKFDDCKNFLCDIFEEFIRLHGYDIPLDWNYFSFGLDSLETSCEFGEWVCSSDGFMNFGNYNEETKDYDEFVKCM